MSTHIIFHNLIQTETKSSAFALLLADIFCWNLCKHLDKINLCTPKSYSHQVISNSDDFLQITNLFVDKYLPDEKDVVFQHYKTYSLSLMLCPNKLEWLSLPSTFHLSFESNEARSCPGSEAPVGCSFCRAGTNLTPKASD